MTTGLSLLILAMQLLTAVVNAPNLPQTFRDQAVQVAQIAIQESNRELALEAISASSTSIVVPTITPDIIQQVINTTPVFSGTPPQAPMPTQPIDQSAITIENLGQIKKPNWDPEMVAPFGMYWLKVKVLDSNGQTKRAYSPKDLQPISMTIDGKTEDQKIDAIDSEGQTYRIFSILPMATGTIHAIFNSGNLTNSYDLVVQ